MKHLPSAIIFLAATAAAVPMKYVLLNQIQDMLLVPNQSRGNRKLQLSDECMEANLANAENPVFVSILNDTMSECPEATTVTETSLTMDFSICPSWTDGVKEACDAVNGKSWRIISLNLEPDTSQFLS